MQRVLRLKFESMYLYADRFNETFNHTDIIKFKTELRSVRSIIDTIKIHKGERAFQFGESCKKIYNTAGFLVEIFEQIESEPNHTTQPLNKVQLQEEFEIAISDWKKVYSKAALSKLEKNLSEFDFTKLPIVVANNLIKRYDIVNL